MIVRYGKGVRTSTPYFGETIKVAYDRSITCFGITLITSTVAIIDCVKSLGGATQRSLSNYYYITSEYGDHKQEYERIGDCYTYLTPFGRKTIKYDTSHDGIN